MINSLKSILKIYYLLILSKVFAHRRQNVIKIPIHFGHLVYETPSLSDNVKRKYSISLEITREDLYPSYLLVELMIT